MDINGLQKLTLLDYPGKTACTVFLAGCNMKCPFCHNSELITGNAPVEMTDEDLLKFLNKRSGLLDGVAFTGGEPLLRKELPELFRKIKKLGYGIKLDTNGTSPKTMKTLIDEKLVDYIAMDIKNSPKLYSETAGFSEFSNIDNILESINTLINSETEYEFRTTVVDQLHSEESFKDIGPMIKGAKRYFLQPFVDRDSVAFSGFSAPSKEKLSLYKKLVEPYVKNVEIRGISE